MKVAFLLLIAIPFAAKSQAQNADTQKVITEMTAMLTKYGKAVEEMDVAETIRYFDNSPQFYVFADGEAYSLDEMKTLVRNGFFEGLKKIKITWDKIEVKPLDMDKAVCLVKQTQLLTNTRDEEVTVSVTATFVGVRTRDGWKIRYIHANHKSN